MICPKCAHECDRTDAERVVFCCNECGARIAFGQLAPRIFLEHAESPGGAPMISVSLNGTTAKLDYGQALRLVKELLIMVTP